MNRITNEQREAIVREAVAKRDAFLSGQSAPWTMPAEARASLRHYLSAAMVFNKGGVLEAFDEWFALADVSGVKEDGEAWEQAARNVLANPRPIEEIKQDIAEVRQRIAGVDVPGEGQQ